MKHLFLTLLLLTTAFLLLPKQGYCQSVFIISGKVTDRTNQPLPNTTLHLHGVPGGTMTKADGSFIIHTNRWSDTLELTSSGFKKLKVALPHNATEGLTLQMEPDITVLQNVVFNLKMVDKEPGKTFMKKVIANKPHNDPNRFNSYLYEQYNRHEVDISNLDTATKNSKGLKNLTLGIYRGIDTANRNSPELPLYFSETLSSIYHSNASSGDQEKVEAKKMLGLETDDLLRRLDKFNFRFNVYDDWLPVFSQSYASPLSNTAFDYYNFYFSDSSVVAGKKVYKIRFIPKQSFERAFIGSLWIDDSSYAINRIEMRLDRTADLNFVKDIQYKQTYQRIVDSSTGKPEYMPHQYTCKIVFENGAALVGLPVAANKKSPVLTVMNTVVIDHIQLNVPLPAAIADAAVNQQFATATGEPESFWQQHRLDTLSRRERSIYRMVDSLENNKRYRHTTKAITTIGSGFYTIGNSIRFGPVASLLSTNVTEGIRTRTGFQTLPGISKNLGLNGYIAYGTKDGKLKGGLGMAYVWNREKWSNTSLSVSSDYDYLLEKSDELDNDNLLTSVARKNIPSIRVFTKAIALQQEQFVSKNMTLKAGLDYQELTPVFPFAYRPISKLTDQPVDTAIGHTLPVAEISIGLRYSKNERKLVRNYDLWHFETYNPILTLNYTYGLELGEARFPFQKINVGIRQNLKLPPKSLLYYNLTAGKTIGTAPYLILNVPPGNESYIDSRYYFNTMTPYEFAADEYVNLHTRLYLGGSLFDHIPLLNKLGWRERLSYNLHWGSMTAANRAYNSNAAFKVAEATPFSEAGVGVENIFHLISVDYFRRLTNTLPGAGQNGGVFVGFKLAF